MACRQIQIFSVLNSSRSSLAKSRKINDAFSRQNHLSKRDFSLFKRPLSSSTQLSSISSINPSKKSSSSERLSDGRRSLLVHSTIENHYRVYSTSVEETYQRKTPVEHVLLRPDTYIGGVDSISTGLWISSLPSSSSNDQLKHQIIWKETCEYPPGLFKIFDEVLVNASDNKQRDSNMTKIEIQIDEKEGTISIFNDGKGIPIQKHKVEGVYVPELIFGQLFTGSNFDDKQAKVTGGRNGYGAKLANIYSTEFKVETCSSHQVYSQTWRNNMSEKDEPTITKVAKTDPEWTKITFKPDLTKFGMSSLKENDIISLMSRRAYDVAGCNEGIAVYLNGNLLPSGFDSYLGLYDWTSQGKTVDASAAPQGKVPEITRINSRWQVGVEVSQTGTFNQISFVNSINTSRGGTHVNHITDQVIRYLSEELRKRSKELRFSPAQIKNHLNIYINCLVENPAFDSQTKETLTTRYSTFGSKCHLSERWLAEMVQRTGMIDSILQWGMMKQQSELTSKSGRTNTRVVGIPKLYDANLAGSPQSSECTLILTEGDSAKALAVSGLSQLGRDKYGVFPLRGKLLNVSDASHKQLMENEEINHLVTILGLNYEKEYGTLETRDLRYGKVMLMTDQDHDGSHIKGLVINFFHHFWPSLLKTDDFLQEFITPIIKASKGKNKKTFFTIPEYNQWRDNLKPSEAGGWHAKYYKGLGTNTTDEAKEYFRDLPRHQIPFQWTENSKELIEMAFLRGNVGQRKTWLRNFEDDGRTFLDHTNLKKLPFSEFINKEFILFSRADMIRSIPSLIDGLKPGQRKVLYATFKKNLKQEIKVAQLAGYVAENTAYHHGEVSLHSTIVNMAQNFVGSNNIPLLFPSGQFGSRLQGGKDAASARYLFTKLTRLTRLIFPEIDDDLLIAQNEDGQDIQPVFFVPIIPMVLVNGAQGVGTGWSTTVPSFSPLDIIDNLLNKMDKKEMSEMKPWYKGFKGTIESKGQNKFVSRGTWEKVNQNTLIINELPIGTWIDDYKDYLDSLIKTKTGNVLRSYTMQHTSDGSAQFTLKFGKYGLDLAEANGIEKKLKLESPISLSNIHLFDQNNQLQKLESPTDVIDAFFPIRLEYYDKRKAHVTSKLAKDVLILSNKSRFCSMVSEGKIVVGGRSKSDLISQLKQNEFSPLLDLKENALEEKEEEKPKKGESEGFDYLLSIPLYSLTSERMEKLEKEKTSREKELKKMQKATAIDLWREELISLREEIVKEFEK
eukprot:TRINITY_DN6686_c0_g1_i1.p1 TRINITY_DN6686_c0_g1~~TRINITY_DN6686_c0_g1_i1.p1  ORF type:complete len:1240 (-),score=441.38 TRINITY_DN6686_c0_g1_i1:349-4068(-)